MNRPGLIERTIEAISPTWAAARARGRVQAAAYRQAYEAVEQTHLRQQQQDKGSGNAIVSMTAAALRNHARHLDRNHDIISGGLSTLVTWIVGAHGINVVPQPRDQNGNIVEEVVDQIMPVYRAWSKRPEVTWQHDWPSAQRLLVRTWLRDGEALLQELVGLVPFLEHGSAVPYSLELIEPDMVPLDMDDSERRILQGVEANAWGRPTVYHVYKRHPGDPDVFVAETKRVPASLIRHLRIVNRINQRRGESILASTFTRVEDLKDYEESERIAAKIGASMAAAIIKGDAQSYDPDKAPKPRTMSAAPQDLRQLTPDELRALSAALASILKTPPEAVLDWPLAQTLSAAVIAGQAFLEVNGPYLQRDVVPAIERLTAFSASVTAALSKAQ